MRYLKKHTLNHPSDGTLGEGKNLKNLGAGDLLNEMSLDASNISSRRSIRVLLGLLHPYRFQVALLLVLAGVSALLEGVGLGLLVPTLQSFTSPDALRSGNPVIDLLSRPFLAIAPENRLRVLMLVLLVTTALKNGAVYGQALLGGWLRVNLMRGLRCRMYDQLLRVGYKFIAEHRTGELWNDLTTETNRAGQVLTGQVQQVAILLVAAVYASLLLTISWPLTLLVLAVLGLLSLLLKVVVKMSREAGEQISRSYAQHGSIGLEGLAAMRVIRLFGREDFELERFERAVNEANRADLRSIHAITLMPCLSEMFAMGMFALVVLLAARMFMGQTEALLPLLLTFLFILYRLMPRVTQFNSNRAMIANNLPAVEAVVRMLSPEGKPFIKSGTQRFDRLRKGIRFEGVKFSYKSLDGPVLNRVDIGVPAGKTTAIVGASGAGKSTLVDLIPRFYDPDEGRITADGTDIRELDLVSWRSMIGVVSQDTFLFNASVRDNIAYGKLDATDEEIKDACRRANALGFICEMPQGFETVIGDRGVRLSGGQRQRIAIARAILRNPQVLILDEATSALDTASERLVQEALEELSENRTVVVVAHRLSTIVQADQVIVLEDGRIVEKGTHQQLLEEKGAYWRYYTMQFAQATV